MDTQPDLLALSVRPTLLIDGNYAVQRAWHGHAGKTLSTTDGRPTGVIHSFLMSLCTLYAKFQPEDIIICWDSKSEYREKRIVQYREYLDSMLNEVDTGDTLRDHLLTTHVPNVPRWYKASRHEKRTEHEQKVYAEQLHPQKAALQAIIPAMGIRQLRVDGVEGDDLIGLVSQKLQMDGKITYIISSDHDLYQLLTPAVLHYNPAKDQVTTVEDFRSQHGIEPEHWPDIKAVAGDDGDDIPGVPGMGIKTVLALFRDAGVQTLTELFAKAREAAESKKKRSTVEKRLVKVHDYHRQIRFAYDLCYILSDVSELTESQHTSFWAQWAKKPVLDWDALKAFTQEYELRKAWAELQLQLNTPHIQLAKAETLTEVLHVWGEACTRCPLADTRHRMVTHTGPDTARLMVIHDSPSVTDDYYGKSLAGAAGEFFDEQFLHPHELKREDIHLTQLVCCLPANEDGHRDPTPIEIAACLPRLRAHIRVVQPEWVVLLGEKSFRTFFPQMGSMAKYRGNKLTHPQFPGIIFFPTYHPAYISYLALNHSDRLKSRIDWKTIRQGLTNSAEAAILASVDETPVTKGGSTIEEHE